VPSDAIMRSAGPTGTTIVHFNVGGTHYEVSRSLLESYPDTMLARMASKMRQQQQQQQDDDASHSDGRRPEAAEAAAAETPPTRHAG
jgi:BTB/POZ domain